MFELCRLRCEYAELHAPSSFGLDELLVKWSAIVLYLAEDLSVCSVACIVVSILYMQ